MSFFNNFQSDRFPGPITGNPLHGLCEKVCIQVNKVFDACMKQVTEENVSVTVTDPVPANPALPLTFLSAKNLYARGTITNLTVDRLNDKPKYARVKGDVNIPIEVIYLDANGVEGKGLGSLTVSEDVILHVPEASIIPFTIEAVTGAVCPEGTFQGGSQFNVTACITVILKVVVEVELLVPSYGYCPIPPCQEYNQELCATYFELPLFPGSAPTQTNT